MCCGGESGRERGLLVKLFHPRGLLTFGKIASDHSEEERKLYFADSLSYLYTQLAWTFVATWPSFLELTSSQEGTGAAVSLGTESTVGKTRTRPETVVLPQSEPCRLPGLRSHLTEAMVPPNPHLPPGFLRLSQAKLKRRKIINLIKLIPTEI